MAGKVLHQTQSGDAHRDAELPEADGPRADDGSREHVLDPRQSQNLAETWEQRSADLFNMNLDDLDSILEASLDPQSVAWWP